VAMYTAFTPTRPRHLAVIVIHNCHYRFLGAYIASINGKAIFSDAEILTALDCP
jgi:hypothetical protein